MKIEEGNAVKRKLFGKGWLKSFWTMCATSFTGVVLLMAILKPLGWEGYMTPLTVWQLFGMCATISAAMLLWDYPEGWLERLNFSPNAFLFLNPLLRCAVVCLIVLFEGVLFGFYPLSWESVIGLLPVVVPVFAVTYAVTAVNSHWAKKNAEEINRKIMEKKTGKRE